MLEQEYHPRFCKARRSAIAQEFSHLNPEQREGVLTTEGPLLLLAGAGSGKTTVLINRITNLLRFGRGSDSAEVPGWVSEDDLNFLEHYPGKEGCTPQELLRMERLCMLEAAKPWEILAITFTNKAAGELKERLARSVGPASASVWAATFHSACVRILRREIERIGYPASFTIYDTDDSIRLIKRCLKDANRSEKDFVPRAVLAEISRAKGDMQSPEALFAAGGATGNVYRQRVSELYADYQQRLERAGALDFDDIILKTVTILQEHHAVREFYQKKFRYVLVDEYQDTNHLQYLLAKILAGGRGNFCVVGDDDQSIYRFRGATIENILSFEQEYPKAKVIRLEQNYRSTGHILDAANAVIGNNEGRKGKKLWTEQGQGRKIQMFQAANELDEAGQVAAQILSSVRDGRKFRDHAILYRMNAQANQIEMALRRSGIPYKVIGGFRFFERAEIRDVLAYLWVIANPHDDLRLARIINVPARGIGQKTMEEAMAAARREGCSLWTVLLEAERHPALERSRAKLQKVTDLIRTLQECAANLPLSELYEQLLQQSGYRRMLEEKGAENEGKLENVKEFQSTILGYLENAEAPSLAGFLDEIALYSDLDGHDAEADSAVLMTMHSAKGLEFPLVFLVGMEEGVFPGFRSLGESEEMEEERRLCYVALTRAREELHLSCAAQRMLYGKTAAYLPSRFIREIPPDYLDVRGMEGSWHGGFDSFDDWNQSERPAQRTQPGQRAPWEGAAPRPARGWEEAPRQRVSYRPPAKKGAPLPSYAVGDMVEHQVFGKGMLLSLRPMGGDALLEVAFDQVGTKRLMLKAAAQHMQKL